MKKINELETKPTLLLLAKYSIPAVVAMLVNAIYNVVDRIFIGKFAGEQALAGLTIVFPVMMLTFAFANLIGIGGSALMSIKLGEKNLKEAGHVFGNTIGLAFVVNMILLIVMYFNLNPMLSMLGASPEVLSYARDYLEIILLGFIFQMMSFVLSNTVRNEGYPLLSMISLLTAAISNIILDYIFIVTMGMGVKGAAIGTIIGQLLGFLVLLSFYLRGKSSLKVCLKDFIPEWIIVKQILMIGFSGFIGTLGTSVSMSFFNKSLGVYGGTAAITSLGAINSLYTFFIMPIMGMQQGMQPIISYNYGAKKMKRAYSTLKQGIIIGMIFSTVVFLLMEISPNFFIGLFLDRQSETIDIAVRGLRIFMLALPVLCINFFGVAFFQSINHGKVSMLLSLLRQFIFLLPLVLILPNFFNLDGVWLATPISDSISVLLTVLALFHYYVKHKQESVFA